jgi:hypothetical protein
MALNSFTIQQAKLGLWLPEPHDSLIQTLSKVYGLSIVDPLFKEVLALHMALNPDIFAAHQPLRKKVIYLADIHLSRSEKIDGTSNKQLLTHLRKEKAGLSGAKQRLEIVTSSNPVEVEAMRFVLGFNEIMGNISTGLGIATNVKSTLTGKHLFSDVLEFNKWSSEKAVLIKANKSRDILHHYDARMDSIVNRIKARLGPTERFLFNGSTTKDALFNGVSQSLRPGAITIRVAERIAQAASNAKFGGAALLLVDGALTCQKLAVTPEQLKVETAYTEVGGFYGALIVGATVGLAVTAMSTPVGWVGAIIIGSGGAFGGHKLGSIAGRLLHSEVGDLFELKNGRMLKSWCN